MKKKLVAQILVGMSVMLMAAMAVGCVGGSEEEVKVDLSQVNVEELDMPTQEELDSIRDGIQSALDDAKEQTEEGQVEQDEEGQDLVYKPVVDEFMDAYNNGIDFDKEYKYLSTGFIEMINYYDDKEQLLTDVKYMVKDISGDGTPALLMGYDDETGRSYVLSGYTYKDGELVCFLEGWGRNSYSYVGNGGFYYFGSGGAVYSYQGFCHVNEDATELEWESFFFTDVDENENIIYYHNSTGSDDPAQSAVFEGTEEEFWNIEPTTYETLPWKSIKELI